MTLMKNIQHVFPRATDIPEAHLKYIPCIQTGYLVNGEIRVWDGPRQEVLSPVWMANDNGPKPFSIGEYPHLHRAGSQKQIPGDRFHFVNVNTLKKGGNYRG